MDYNQLENIGQISQIVSKNQELIEKVKNYETTQSNVYVEDMSPDCD